ncbi:hypothetical protein EG861_14180 [Enterococcus faecalis]|nr:hypothetical protein EG871_14635 [Enterococcus faecium]RXF09455.1 hypothetical protein EG878_16455 [Enterococcus faecalis]RXF52625.1 hypothetical protein EG861_14180 [Enterococcus faecalis]
MERGDDDGGGGAGVLWAGGSRASHAPRGGDGPRGESGGSVAPLSDPGAVDPPREGPLPTTARAGAIVPGRPEGAWGAPTGRAEGGVDAPGEDKQRGRAPG